MLTTYLAMAFLTAVYAVWKKASGDAAKVLLVAVVVEFVLTTLQPVGRNSLSLFVPAAIAVFGVVVLGAHFFTSPPSDKTGG